MQKSNSMNRSAKIKLLVIIFIVSIVIVLVFVFFNNYYLKKVLSEDKEIKESIQTTGQAKEFTITASQFKFEPNKIEVNKGDKIKITAYSNDVSHGLALPEFEVYLYLEKNNPKTIEFIADKSGKFQYFCNAFCGDGHGNMKGELIVN